LKSDIKEILNTFSGLRNCSV